jgi:HEAT repeat protein/cyclophilin family peptidyl-prolyl cis-trans isomerase
VAQLRDTASIAWFDSLLASPATAPAVVTEAARGLGMLNVAPARAALARFLGAVEYSPRTRASIGEALLAIGRQETRATLEPVVRWATAADDEVRWRAAWALWRPGDPAATRHLLRLSDDPSPTVRMWAVRGLAPFRADSAALRPRALARLLAAMRDRDRGVRASAARVLTGFGERAALDALAAGLRSGDPWIAAFMAEVGRPLLHPGLVPALTDATADGQPCMVRHAALRALGVLDTAAAAAAALPVLRDPVVDCRIEAVRWIGAHARGSSATARVRAQEALDGALRDSALAVRRAALQLHLELAALDGAARRAAFVRALGPGEDALARGVALAVHAAAADTSDLAALLDVYDRAQVDTLADVATGAATAIASLQRRRGVGAQAFFSRFAPPADRQRRSAVEGRFADPFRWPPAPVRTTDEYRAIVERWIVPEYEGRPRPRARWDTPRGSIDVELYGADAPLATEEFARLTASGALAGTSFLRTVPVFVAQQATVPGSRQQREEVNRHRLTRGNLSWANAGYDRGSPGYTLSITPQPHNEGEFTSLGRVVAGMAAVERLEVGDRITAARMLDVSRGSRR